MIERLRRILSVRELRRRILVTLCIFALFRFVASIPAPGADPEAIRSLFRSSQLLGLLNVVSGGVMDNFSILALGLGPYITASIIIQMMTNMIPQLEQLAREEGEYGREKINQYTRYLSIPLAILQAFAMYFFFMAQGNMSVLLPLDLCVLVVTLVSGTMFLVWLGEQLSQYGIGNGTSMLIFAGIVSSFPRIFGQTLKTVNSENIFPLLSVVVVAFFVVYLIVKINESARLIPVRYARKVRSTRLYGGQDTNLPLKINNAGVIPILYAVSLVLLPTFAGNLLAKSPVSPLATVGSFIVKYLRPSSPLYLVTYFSLVVGFTYFSTASYFNPDRVADDIKKQGGFVPGIRPGRATADYLSYILTRITLLGGLFLGLVAVLPSITKGASASSLTIGGTGLLIAVSVVLETLKQIEALLVTREYEGFL